MTLSSMLKSILKPFTRKQKNKKYNKTQKKRNKRVRFHGGYIVKEEEDKSPKNKA